MQIMMVTFYESEKWFLFIFFLMFPFLFLSNHSKYWFLSTPTTSNNNKWLKYMYYIVTISGDSVKAWWQRQDHYSFTRHIVHAHTFFLIQSTLMRYWKEYIHVTRFDFIWYFIIDKVSYIKFSWCKFCSNSFSRTIEMCVLRYYS